MGVAGVWWVLSALSMLSACCLRVGGVGGCCVGLRGVGGVGDESHVYIDHYFSNLGQATGSPLNGGVSWRERERVAKWLRHIVVGGYTCHVDLNCLNCRSVRLILGYSLER